MSPRRRLPHRYLLKLPVRYRSSSADHWHEATTRSISAHSVTIASKNGVSPGDTIAVVVSLPDVPGHLVGRGHVAAVNASTFAVDVSRFTIGRQD